MGNVFREVGSNHLKQGRSICGSNSKRNLTVFWPFFLRFRKRMVQNINIFEKNIELLYWMFLLRSLSANYYYYLLNLFSKRRCRMQLENLNCCVQGLNCLYKFIVKKRGGQLAAHSKFSYFPIFWKFFFSFCHKMAQKVNIFDNFSECGPQTYLG